MQHKVQMKRHGSLGMKAVLALETLVVSYFRPSHRNFYFHLSQTWITSARGQQLDYLKHIQTVQALKIHYSACIWMEIRTWKGLPSHHITEMI